MVAPILCCPRGGEHRNYKYAPYCSELCAMSDEEWALLWVFQQHIGESPEQEPDWRLYEFYVKQVLIGELHPPRPECPCIGVIYA